MSRASVSHSGRLGNLKVAGLNLELTQTNDFKIDTFSLPSPAFGIIRIGQRLVGSVSG